MDPRNAAPHVVRFGVFELDTQSGELRRRGLKIRLPDQSFQILRLLLSRAGEVVTREELRHALWTSETFVDFEVGLNSAIRKLREALDDSPENARFVETLPRRGYRFIAPVNPPAVDQPRESEAPTKTANPSRRGLRAAWVAAALLLTATIAAFGVVYARGGFITAAVGHSPAASATSQQGRRTIHPDAYDAYLKGVKTLGARRYEDFRTAVVYFEEATARQPDFADAHAALAQAQVQFLHVGPLSPRETIPRAEAAARKALELDATLPIAHRALGMILTFFHWKWEDGEKEFQLARELSGGTDEASAAANLSLIRNGRFAEARADAERARERDPLSLGARVNIGSAYRAAGQHDRAIAEFRRALEMNREPSRIHFQLGVTYVAMANIDDAIDELEAAVGSARGRDSRLEAYLAYLYAVAGRPLDARRIVETLESRRREQYVSSFGIALIHDALGEKERAMTAFERAYEDRAVEFAQTSEYPAFKTIASEPRFQALMRLVGLPRYTSNGALTTATLQVAQRPSQPPF